MTSPIVIQQPGFGQAIQEGLAPLINALQQRQDNMMRREELQLGQDEMKLRQQDVKLKTDEAALKQQQEQQYQQALAAFAESMGGLFPQGQAQPQDPSQPAAPATQPAAPQLGVSDEAMAAPPADPIRAAIGEPPFLTSVAARQLIASGDPRLVQEAVGLIQDEVIFRRLLPYQKQFAQATAPEERLQAIVGMASVDPAHFSSALAAALGTASAGAMSATERYGGRPTRVRGNSPFIAPLAAKQGMTLNPDSFYTVLMGRNNEGPMMIVGEGDPSSSLTRLQQGSGDQRNAAEGGVGILAPARIIRHYMDPSSPAHNPEAVNKVAGILTLTETANTAPMGFSGFLEYVSRTAANQELDQDSQILWNNFYDAMARVGFGSGGRQLTASEWAKDTRTIGILLGDEPGTMIDKLLRLDRRWRVLQAKSSDPVWRHFYETIFGEPWDNAPEFRGPGLGVPPTTPPSAGGVDPDFQARMDAITGRKKP